MWTLRNCGIAQTQLRKTGLRKSGITKFCAKCRYFAQQFYATEAKFCVSFRKNCAKVAGGQINTSSFLQKSFFFLSLKLMQRYLMIQKIHVFKLILICLNKKYVSEANFKNHSFRIYVLWIRKLFVKVYIGPVLFNAQSICLQIRTAVQLIDHQRRCETRKVTVHVNI